MMRDQKKLNTKLPPPPEGQGNHNIMNTSMANRRKPPHTHILIS